MGVHSALRGSLLTGASAFALSVSSYSGHAQAVYNQSAPPQWTVWIEGASFQTGGGNINVPTLPGLTTPLMSFSPKGGFEGAGGFDYDWMGPWHVVFDIRYGKSRTATAATGSSSSSFTSGFLSSFPFPFFSSTTSTSNSQTGSEHESHLVTDFMIGRDYGLGTTHGQVQFGVRVADLGATVNVAQMAQTTTTTFFSDKFFPPTTSTSTSEQTASGTFRSRFLGFGPRIAFTDSVPLNRLWSFDYLAGIAALFGNRTLNYSVLTNPGGTFGGEFGNHALIFNPDAWADVSYHFNPRLALSAGIRADYYANALITYNGSGGFTTVDRLFWGPFLRLTGNF